MKGLALVCVAISLLTGCATEGEPRPMKNGDLYVGGGISAQEHLSMDNSVQSIRDAQIAGSGSSVRHTYGTYSEAGGLLHALMGYQVAKALDLEAMVFTNHGNSHQFSSGYNLYDPSTDHPPFFGRYTAKINGELLESGATLTALVNWRLHELFSVFARFGGSYSQTTLDSRLERELGDDKFINQVKYRTEGVRPLWAIGFTASEIVRIEYLTRKIPIGSIASELSTASHGSFDTPKIGDSETFHSFMISVRLGRLKKPFGNKE